MIDRPHQIDQLAVDDADKLLGRIERFQHRLADGLLGDPVHEILDDRKTDIGLKQRAFDQFQAVAHVRLGEPSATAKGPQGRTQVFLKRLEHGNPGRQAPSISFKIKPRKTESDANVQTTQLAWHLRRRPLSHFRGPI